METKIANAFHGGLWMDSIPEQQPPDTYSYALNAVEETADFNSFGRSNEPSNELIGFIPEGFIPRGWMDLPDKNKFIIGSFNPHTGTSEMGFIDRKNKTYTKYFNDEKWDSKINFGLEKKINFSFYIKGDCDETHIQWSSCKTYFVLNIDEPFCDIQYSDILLFDCNCAGALKTQVIPKGGVNLIGGAYWAIMRFTDVDDNHTNWYWLSNQTNLRTRNNAPGEVSRDALRIEIPKMDSRRYDYVEIAILRRVGGIFEVKQLPKIFYSRKKQIYNLGSEQEFLLNNLTIDSIFQKEIGWIRGDDIDAKEGHSILFNTYNNPNYDIQGVADNVKVSWVAYLCPIAEAHKYKTMPRNEVVPLGLRRNYCDGNYSNVGHIKGRKANSYDLEKISNTDNRNCSLCDEPRWKVENTAKVTKWYCGNPFEKSEESSLQPKFEIEKQNATIARSEDSSTTKQPKQGSVLSGVAIRDTCAGTCTNNCGQVGSCCNGVCTDCGNSKGGSCGGGGCSGSNGNCGGSGGCGGGGCAGGGCNQGSTFQGTGVGSEESETSGILNDFSSGGNCQVNITLYTNPDICVPCRNLENSGILDQIAGALPKYTVNISKVKAYGPSNSMPEFYVDCGGTNFRVKSITLDNIVSAVTSKCNCQDTYNCTTNGCEPAGSNGEWSSYNECYANCPAEKTKKNKYSCDSVSGKCIQDDAGAYDNLLTCAKNCVIVDPDVNKYACISGKCVKDASGTYDSILICAYNCESADTKRHTCTEEGCKESANGEYNNLTDCLTNCDVNGKGNGGGCGGNSGGCGGGGGCGSGGCGSGGCGGTGCGSGCGDNGGGCGGGTGCGGGCNGGSGGCNSCKNNGCGGIGCPEGGCDPKTSSQLPCPPGDPCAEVITYGGHYPLEGMDIPGLVSCLKLPCSDFFFKTMDLKMTVPLSVNSEIDIKNLLIKNRDGSVYDLRKTPVYYPPKIEFTKTAYEEKKEEQPLTPRSPLDKWACITNASGDKECVLSASGFSSKAECVANCPGNKQHYRCDTAENGDKRCKGGFTTGFNSYAECVSNCPGVIIESGYECITQYGVKACFATGKGPYETVEECIANSDCSSNDPNNPDVKEPHACVTGKCTKDPNGPYSSLYDCYRACEAGAGPRLNCPPVPQYDDTGCVVIGYDLPIFAEGELGYWESEEKYSMEQKCENDYMYGLDAGMPIRHHLFPSADILPTHISYQNGVPHKRDPSNLETNDTYVILLGLKITGIAKIEDEKVPGCKEAGWTIMMPEMDSTNSRVVANGLAVNTFLIDSHGQKMAVPNYGVNSLERFSPYNKLATDTSEVPHRGGTNNDTSSYCFFSPDTLYREEPLNAHKVHAQLEIFGQGWNHGMYVDGERPEEFFRRKKNERGGRASINLNHYNRAYQRELVSEGFCDNPLQMFLRLYIKYDKLSNKGEGYWELGMQLPKEEIATLDLKLKFSGVSGEISLTEELSFFTDSIDFSAQPRNRVTGTVTGRITTKEGCIFDISGLEASILVPEDSKEQAKGIGTVTIIASNKRDAVYRDNSVTTCLKNAEYVTANSILPKGDFFTYPLNNLYRERSVFFENVPDINGQPIYYRLNNGIDSFLTDGLYNGHPFLQNQLQANNTCDGSFMGFARFHEYYIFNAAGHYVSLLRYLPKQHGILENIQYKELYTLTETETICGIVVKPIGVNYLGQYSIKRHAFVTDRIGADVSKGSWFSTAYGVVNCGEVPVNGGSNDPRTVDNMRPGDYWNGRDQFAGHTGIHKWYPNLYTCNVTFVVESKVNTHLLQLGNEEEPMNEVIYPHLKSLNIDANFPPQSDPRMGWLNRYRWNMHEPSAFEKLLMIFISIAKLLLLIWVFNAGAAITLTSVAGYVNFALALSIALVINIWLTNERVMKILGYKDCLAEQDGGPDWGEMEGWHDLHDLYNTDYNHDMLGRGIGIPLNYNLCPCYEELNRRVYWSSKQLVSANGDAFRHFKINNFREVPSNWGRMQRVIHFGNRMWFQTTDGKWNTNFGNLGIEMADSRYAQLGTGQLISEPYNIYGDIKEGFGGTIDPSASLTCLFGDFYIDRKARRIYQFNGQDKPVSDLGVREFLQENLEIFVVRDFPDYPSVSEAHSIGFSMGIDPRLNRLLITKVDYEALHPEQLRLEGDVFYDTETNELAAFENTRYWRNRTFTLSYSLAEKRLSPWISFHSYAPSMYLWDRKNLYSFHKNGIYKHDTSRDSFQTFYNEYYPFIISFIAKGQGNMANANFTYQQTRAVLKNLVWDERSKSWRKANRFFDYVGILNNYQSSGMHRVAIDSQDNKQKERLMVTPVALQYEFHALQNLVSADKDISEILEVCNYILPNMLKDLVKFDKDLGYKHDSERQFYDEFLKYTFVKYDTNDHNVQMILRHVITKVSTTIEDE